jgi:uncharacterized membrane protein
MTPELLREELRSSDDCQMQCRRGIIVASLAGMAAMGAVTLLQTGLLKRLPELPLRGFDAEAVTLSRTAFALGLPDGSLSLASFAANIALAAAGGTNRGRWLPIAASAKAGVESLVSLWYLRHEKAWCSYCLVAASANFAIFGLSLAELRRARFRAQVISR